MQLPRLSSEWRTIIRDCFPAFMILGTMAICLLPFAIWGCSTEIESWLYSRPFNTVVWRKATDENRSNWPPRLCMVDDLLASKRLDGMTKGQVIDLLGPPDSERNSEFSYYLGPERQWIRLENEFLTIKFGVDGNVRRYWITAG